MNSNKIILKMSFFILLSSSASADILMLDVNFAEKEVATLKQIAKSRGENLIVIPTRDITPEDLPKFRELNNKNTAHHAAWLKAYDAQKPYAHQAEWDQVLQELQPLTDKYSLTEEVLDKALTEIKDKKVTSLVVSGHSEGSEYFGSLGTISFATIHEQLVKHGKADDLKSVYLWGCFTATQGAALRWHESYPNLPFIAGFRLRAPSNVNPANTAILKSLMTTQEDKLHTPESIEKVGEILQTLNRPYQTSLAAVSGSCSCYIDGTTGRVSDVRKLPKDCIGKVTYLTTEMQKSYTPYLRGEKELPNPDASETPLRDFYNKLQNSFMCLDHCKSPEERRKLKSGLENDLDADNYPETNLPCPSTTIKLIKFSHIYSNFRRLIKSELSEIASQLTKQKDLDQKCKTMLDPVHAPILKNIAVQTSTIDSCLSSITDPSLKDRVKKIGLRQSNLTDFSCIPLSWIDENDRPEPMICD